MKTRNREQTMRAVMAAMAAGFAMAAATAAGIGTGDAVTCRVELDRGVLPAGQAQKAVLKISLEGVAPAVKRDRPPVNLAIVLDKSGSMQGEKIARAREAAIEAVRRLDANDIVSLVVYDSGVRTLSPARAVGKAGDIEDLIRGIEANGNTALFGGIGEAASELRKNLEPRYVHRAILLSDGLANVGPSSPEELGRLGAALIKEGISVTTVGVGTDYNEDLMARLARSSDGNTYFVRESADLVRIFLEELGDVLTVVAKKVRIEIDFDGGAKPIAVLGREGRITHGKAEVTLGQLYGGQEKFALIEVEIPAGEAGAARGVATARVTFEDALSGKQGAVGAAATAKFSADETEVASAVNRPVRKAYEMNLNAAVQEEVIDLADQGKHKEAARRLAESAANLRQAGEKFGDPELGEKAQEMEQQARELESAGMSSVSRKAMRADSLQTINQQRAK